MNFIEFKRANKSFKSIHSFLANDIFDRFLNFFVLIFIVINGLIEQKIKIDLNNIYFKRICLYFISEFISDYLKGIITFKINKLNPKSIKYFIREEICFYQEISSDSKENNKYTYIYLKETKTYENYFSFIDKDSLICLLLNINIYPFVTIFIKQVFLNNKFFTMSTLSKFLIAITMQYILGIFIIRFNLNFKNDSISNPKKEFNKENKNKIKTE